MTTEARITYSQNWPAYNAAQCDEKHRVQLPLRGLCDGIVQPPHEGRSRKPALLADVVYAATMKVYDTMSGRRSTGDVQACAERGLVSKAPAYNALFKYAERADRVPLNSERCLQIRPFEGDWRQAGWRRGAMGWRRDRSTAWPR